MIPRDRGQGGIYLQYDVLVITLLSLIEHLHPDAANIEKLFSVAIVVAPIDGHKLIQTAQRSEAHCGGDFGHLAVGPYVYDFVVAGKTEILHQTHPGCQLVIVSCHCAAFEGVEELGGVEAEDFRITETANHAPSTRNSKSMRGVKYQSEITAPAYLFNRFHVTGVTPEVNADDSRCARRDHAFDLERIDCVPHRLDVGEYRRDLLPLERMRRGDERERRNDNFPSHAQGANRDFQCNSGVAHGHAVLYTGKLRNALLKFLHELAVIRKPAPIEEIVDARKQHVTITDVRAANMEHLGEG